ncbi:MAG: HPr(Ser) kinase/phosphatase [bacterium]
MAVKPILLSKILGECKDELGLRLLTEGVSLEVEVPQADVGRPGLLLAGFEEGFPAEQVQILGKAEVLYLTRLDAASRARSFGALLDKRVPCIIVTHGAELPPELVGLAAEKRIPVFGTNLSPTETVQYLGNYLLTELAPEASLNGTLVDVYGVGILIRGKSGTGKSECALDLVERGHRLVADDLVRVSARPPGVLVGRSVEPLQNYVEVRGIGLVDIGSIYGIKALRRQKRIETEVNLREWGEEGFSYDRAGLESKRVEILGVKIPSITVPLVAGKSVSVIVEVVALTHILSMYGYNAADSLRQRLSERLKRAGITDFVPRDIE